MLCAAIGSPARHDAPLVPLRLVEALPWAMPTPLSNEDTILEMPGEFRSAQIAAKLQCRSSVAASSLCRMHKAGKLGRRKRQGGYGYVYWVKQARKSSTTKHQPE